MLDFAKIRIKSIVRGILRCSLNLLPRETGWPILKGRLRGKRWIPDSGPYEYWLGNYEYPQQILFTKTISAGSIVFDIGAHVGFYTLLASELVGPEGKVFAFEPLPQNLFYLKEHLRLNGCINVTVLGLAVSDYTGYASFSETQSPAGAHLASNGRLQVEVDSLDSLVSKGKIPLPNFIKIDVEGNEMQVLAGARNIITTSHPTIFLSAHTCDLRQQCISFLKSLGYDLQPIGYSKLEEADQLLCRLIDR